MLTMVCLNRIIWLEIGAIVNQSGYLPISRIPQQIINYINYINNHLFRRTLEVELGNPDDMIWVLHFHKIEK